MPPNGSQQRAVRPRSAPGGCSDQAGAGAVQSPDPGASPTSAPQLPRLLRGLTGRATRPPGWAPGPHQPWDGLSPVRAACRGRGLPQRPPGSRGGWQHPSTQPPSSKAEATLPVRQARGFQQAPALLPWKAGRKGSLKAASCFLMSLQERERLTPSFLLFSGQF